MTERVSCLVPGCRHTRRPGGHPEWLCQVHWPLVPSSLKLRRRRVAYRLQRRGELLRAPDFYEALTPRAARLMAGLWERMKAQAIERAAGL